MGRDVCLAKGPSGRFGWSPEKILRIDLQKHHFAPSLIYWNDISDTFHGIWRALLGNFEGKFMHGLHEGRGSSLPSLPLDARLEVLKLINPLRGHLSIYYVTLKKRGKLDPPI